MSLNKLKLIKILNLTSSDNDHEALSAIRKANSMIISEGLSWDDLIIEEKEHKEEFEFNFKSEDKLRDILDYLLEKNPDNEFIESLDKWYKKSGYLSEKQINTLVKIFKQNLEKDKYKSNFRRGRPRNFAPGSGDEL